ncbi:MAG: hypothetical protein HN348_35720, partial [Proteobacteria bacterium]|nr:hypothetical protein [Pseudomonadota bacterium]
VMVDGTGVTGDAGKNAVGVGMGEIGNHTQNAVGGAVDDDNPYPEAEKQIQEFQTSIKRAQTESVGLKKEAPNELKRCKTMGADVEVAKTNLPKVKTEVDQVMSESQEVKQKSPEIQKADPSNVQGDTADPTQITSHLDKTVPTSSLPAEAGRGAEVKELVADAKKPGWLQKKIISKAKTKQADLGKKVGEATQSDDASTKLKAAQTKGETELGKMSTSLNESVSHQEQLIKEVDDQHKNIEKMLADSEALLKKIKANNKKMTQLLKASGKK